MERVTRISKLTVEHFEQLISTLEGLTREKNSKEILDALNVLKEQVNNRVQELEQLYVVDESIEEKYSKEFVDVLANELLKKGSIKFLVTPSEKLIGLVKKRARELKTSQSIVPNERVTNAVNIKADKSLFAIPKPKYSDAYIESLAREMLETGRLSMLVPPDAVLLNLVNIKLSELKTQVKDMQNRLYVRIPEVVDDNLINNLAHQFLKIGSLKFLNNPPKTLVDAINHRVKELQAEQKTSSKQTEVSDDELITETFDSNYVDELARQVIKTGEIRFLTKPPEGLVKSVDKKVIEYRKKQVKIDEEEPIVSEQYDPAYIDFLAQEVIRTGTLKFTDVPPVGLMTAINNRVIELRELESQKDSVIKL